MIETPTIWPLDVVRARRGTSTARAQAKELIERRQGYWRRRKHRARVARLLRRYDLAFELCRLQVEGRRVYVIRLPGWQIVEAAERERRNK